MFDYGAPRVVPPNAGKQGVGQHPHRGFETVTIAFQGEVQHKDSLGNEGIIKEGDVQWMTAASGIIHEEYISSELSRTGGVVEMAQLWVNLPTKYKMVKPRYQSIEKSYIPVITLPDNAGHIRVIAGTFQGHSGPALTYSPIHVFDVSIADDKTVLLEIEEGHNCIVFVRVGSIYIAGDTKMLNSPQIAIMTIGGGNVLSLKATGGKDAKILILSGEPLNEPIANQGPFVMNTQAELQDAFEEFSNGRFLR